MANNLALLLAILQGEKEKRELQYGPKPPPLAPSPLNVSEKIFTDRLGDISGHAPMPEPRYGLKPPPRDWEPPDASQPSKIWGPAVPGAENYEPLPQASPRPPASTQIPPASVRGMGGMFHPPQGAQRPKMLDDLFHWILGGTEPQNDATKDEKPSEADKLYERPSGRPVDTSSASDMRRIAETIQREKQGTEEERGGEDLLSSPAEGGVITSMQADQLQRQRRKAFEYPGSRGKTGYEMQADQLQRQRRKAFLEAMRDASEGLMSFKPSVAGDYYLGYGPPESPPAIAEGARTRLAEIADVESGERMAHMLKQAGVAAPGAARGMRASELRDLLPLISQLQGRQRAQEAALAREQRGEARAEDREYRKFMSDQYTKWWSDSDVTSMVQQRNAADSVMRFLDSEDKWATKAGSVFEIVKMLQGQQRISDRDIQQFKRDYKFGTLDDAMHEFITGTIKPSAVESLKRLVRLAKQNIEKDLQEKAQTKAEAATKVTQRVWGRETDPQDFLEFFNVPEPTGPEAVSPGSEAYVELKNPQTGETLATTTLKAYQELLNDPNLTDERRQWLENLDVIYYGPTER